MANIIAREGRFRAIFAIGLPTYPRNVLLVSTAMTSSSRARAAAIEPEPFPARAAITRAAAGIGLYAGAFGVTFGAVAVRSGLSVTQAVGMSAVMFTGASQFALVGVLAAGGSSLAALSAALLLGLRNAFYGVPVTRILRPRGLRRIWAAHFVVDESAAMAVAQRTSRAGRYAFWATGVTLYILWTLGTLAGALVGSGIDTSALGLDAAAPAIFLALLWPQLSRERGRAVALGAAVVALGLVPLVSAGLPVIAAAAVAILAGLLPARRRSETQDR
jgi:4-azaleucine resistance transporter AzlC